MNDSDIRVVGFRSGACEEDVIEMLRRDVNDITRQSYRSFIRAVEETIVIRQLLQLLGYRRYDGRLAVAQVAAPQTGHAIQYLAAVGITNVDTLRLGNNAPAGLGVIVQIGKRMQVAGFIQRLQVHGARHRCEGLFS